MTPIEQIDAPDLRRRLDAGEEIRLLDVREHPEWEICRIEGAELLPMSEIHRWQHELEPGEGPVVIYCHHGIRSLRVCAFLASQGHRGLLNLRGGIAAWRDQVDPGMAGY